MEVFAHMPAYKPHPWLMSLEMYNDLVPWFGHTPIPPAPKFPTTDSFIMNWKNISIRLHGQEIGTIKQYKHMTEQSLIEYAKAGDTGAIDYLAAHGFEGVDWKHAITHVNGRWLPGHEIKRVWDEMVKINKETGLIMDSIKVRLQGALDAHHMPKEKLSALSPAGRPWDFNGNRRFVPVNKLRFGNGSNYTPPKKKRK